MALSGSCAILGRHGFNRSAVKNFCDSRVRALILSCPSGIISRCISQADLEHIVTEGETQPPQKPISRAMKAYIQRAKDYETFLKRENQDYEIGKRHLANMMGQPADTFTQEDVNEAIKYLFPSGLYEPKARPIMEDPKKIFPSKKAAEFDDQGRPFHPLFYTLIPNYNQALYDIVEWMEKLDQVQDDEIRKGLQPTPENKADLLRSAWLSLGDMQKLFLETLSEKQYEYFVTSAERLAQHPYSSLCKDFLCQFRRDHLREIAGLVIPPLQYNDQGRPYIEVKHCRFMTATAEVKVWGNGSGLIKINSKDITYFDRIHHREQIIFPLIFSGMENSVDVEATVVSGGPTGQMGAIRWGIAWGLRSFVDPKMVEKMRIAGLLTRDIRTRERKKPGQEGARRKFTWKKR